MSRLPTDLLVSALLRRINDSGGLGVIRARGDAQAGAVLVVIAGHEMQARVLERGLSPAGAIVLVESHTSDDPDSYWSRRRRSDPDLWVVELDSPLAERFAAETLLSN